MSKVLLRNVNPVGYTDLPQIGRVGPSPHFGECGFCAEDPTGEHEHQLANPDAEEPGSGCLVPGEEFHVDAELAGEAPFWRPAEERDVEPGGGIVIPSRLSDDGTLEVLDPGHGLLALVGIFELAAPADGLGEKTIAELQDFAAAHEPPIDLGDAKTKKAILAVIRKAL